MTNVVSFVFTAKIMFEPAMAQLIGLMGGGGREKGTWTTAAMT